MFDQMFERFRKASESSLQAQQELFKQWIQQWQAVPLSASVLPSEWSDLQKRWLETATEALDKHREMIDATYRSGIDVIAQAFRVSEAKSPDDYRRLVEQLWHKLTDTFKTQTENQVREYQSLTEKWLEKAQASRPQS